MTFVNNYSQSPGPSPNMSVNSDLSLGTKKVLHYNSSSMKFFPTNDLPKSTYELKLDLSDNISLNITDQTPKISDIPSPKRSALRAKHKSGTTHFFSSQEGNENNEELRNEHKKKTIKFDEKDEVKFFTMKEMSSKYQHSQKNSRNSISSKNSKNSKNPNSSNTNTIKDDDDKPIESMASGIGALFRNRKDGNVNFGKSITVIMIINHFLKQMKLKSGKFGRLGVKQCKILNDLGHDDENGKDSEPYEFEPNLMARMIVFIFFYLNLKI